MAAAPRLKKRFGQHHLRHPGLCRPLIDFLRPRDRRVLEIGPGGGVLTGELIRAGGRVWAWELDPEWALRLARRPADRALSAVVGDALEIAWQRLPAGTVVTGNLPYAIATRLIQDLLAAAPGVRRAGFLVQAEVGRRLTAAAGDSSYGALSVLVQARAEALALGRVRRASFRPVPKVDGAFVGLRRREPAVPAAQWDDFAAMVRLAFAQRRKTLRNALAARWGRRPVDELLVRLDLPRSVRASELELGQLVAVYRQSRRLP
ncbi:MAG: 16S rRNA (adenine(1518)-N(6)/adenine(1519)-N(6))-dimethyltransferase RsmA [Thermoanaerobaculia bacterium]